MEQKSFGKLADGEGATLYTISNTKGMCAQITDFGAAIVSLVVKDKNGKDTDVVLGYEDARPFLPRETVTSTSPSLRLYLIALSQRL